MTKRTRFKDLKIGQTFDFIAPDFASFYEPCQKVSPRSYVAIQEDGFAQPRYGRLTVGSVNAAVYHVGAVREIK